MSGSVHTKRGIICRIFAWGMGHGAVMRKDLFRGHIQNYK